MRRRRRPEISFIKRNKVLVDRAWEIYTQLKKSPNGDTNLSQELADISVKLKLPYVISEKQAYEYIDDWNKRNIPALYVFVKNIGDGLIVATENKDSKIELIDFEDEYPFSENEVGYIGLAPDAKNSSVFFRDTFFRIFNKATCTDENMISYLGSVDIEKLPL